MVAKHKLSDSEPPTGIRTFSLTYNGRTQKVTLGEGTPSELIEHTVRTLFGIEAEVPLVFADRSGSAVVLSCHLPDNFILSVLQCGGVKPCVEESSHDHAKSHSKHHTRPDGKAHAKSETDTEETESCAEIVGESPGLSLPKSQSYSHSQSRSSPQPQPTPRPPNKPPPAVLTPTPSHPPSAQTQPPNPEKNSTPPHHHRKHRHALWTKKKNKELSKAQVIRTRGGVPRIERSSRTETTTAESPPPAGAMVELEAITAERKFYLVVDPRLTVGDVKRMIRREEGIQVGDQRLVEGSKELSDRKRVAECWGPMSGRWFGSFRPIRWI